MLNSYTNNNTSIIPWGTHLSSNIGLPSFNKTTAQMIELPYFQKSVVIGLILSDAYMLYAGPRSINVLLRFKQSIDKFEYLWSVFNILSHYCKSTPSLDIRFRIGTRTLALYFNTRSLPCFTALYPLFYNNGIKLIPQDIFNLLTPVALAHWIMGDGSKHKSGLILCTDSYSTLDVVRLMNVLIIKYELNCTLIIHSSGGPRIYIKADSMAKLRALVIPYMVRSMFYKIHL